MKPILFPMAFYFFYMFGLAFYMFVTRVRGIRQGIVSHRYFLVYSGELPPEWMLRLGQHYDNQFQVPILFFATGAIFLARGLVTTFTLACAWAFVASRLAHSWVHLGSNYLPWRAGSFALGWLCLAFLWAQLVYFALVTV